MSIEPDPGYVFIDCDVLGRPTRVPRRQRSRILAGSQTSPSQVFADAGQQAADGFAQAFEGLDQCINTGHVDGHHADPVEVDHSGQVPPHLHRWDPSTGLRYVETVQDRSQWRDIPCLFPFANTRELSQEIDGLLEERLSKDYPFVGWGSFSGQTAFAYHVCTIDYLFQMRRDQGLFWPVMNDLIICLSNVILSKYDPEEFPVLRLRTPTDHELDRAALSRIAHSSRHRIEGMQIFSPIKVMRFDDPGLLNCSFLACVQVNGYGARHLNAPWRR